MSQVSSSEAAAGVTLPRMKATYDAVREVYPEVEVRAERWSEMGCYLYDPVSDTCAEVRFNVGRRRFRPDPNGSGARWVLSHPSRCRRKRVGIGNVRAVVEHIRQERERREMRAVAQQQEDQAEEWAREIASDLGYVEVDWRESTRPGTFVISGSTLKIHGDNRVVKASVTEDGDLENVRIEYTGTMNIVGFEKIVQERGSK